MATTKKKVPAKKAETKVAIPFDFAADVGAGMEGADNESFAIPFLRVLQQLSPQCTKGNAEFIEGAEAGMLFNSVTGKAYETLTFLPCAFQRRFLQWAPRGSDRGYGGEFLPEEIQKMRADGTLKEVDGRIYVPLDDGTVKEKKCDHMADTRSHFGIMIGDDEEASQVLLSLSSTQIKKSKQLMSILNSAKIKTATGMVTPPTWMNAIKLSTTLESNDQGSWYGLRVEANGFIESKDLYDAGKAFHDAISAGAVKVNHDESTDAPKGDGF